MSNDILNLANEAADYLPDMTAPTTGGGGGEYTPPPEGVARARLVGYIETGKHEKSVGAGKPKVQKEQVKLVFELSGKGYEPAVAQDGTKLPIRITEELNAGPGYGPLNEKSGLYKLFKRMNHDGTAKHMSQLLGKPFLLTIRHDKKKVGDKERVYVSIRDEGGYLIQPPRFVNPIDNTITDVPVDPPISALRLFLWKASPEVIGKMWDSLFIDGEYPERKNDKGEVTAPAKSKNVFQNEIKSALNFTDSPIFQYLQTKGVALNLGVSAEGNGAASAAAGASSGGSTSAATTAAGTTASPSDDPLAAF